MQKNSKTLFTLLSICLIAFSLTSCSVNKIGKHLRDSVSKGVDTVAQSFVIGIRKQLANPETKKVVTHLLDSIITSLDSTLQPKIEGTVGRVISPRVLLWSDSLIEALTGKKIQSNMDTLQYKLIGKSKEDIIVIRNAFKELLEYILSDDVNERAGLLRDQLLGAKTDTVISRLIDHASKKLASNIHGTIHNQVNTLSGAVITILIIAGLIVLIIIFAIWWSRRKYLRMVALLTKQINDIPDRRVYDHVTKLIKDEAITAGLEPDLRKVLNENGLLNAAQWHEKKTIKNTP